MIISGKLDQGDPDRIEGDWTLPRTQPIPNTGQTIKTTLSAHVNIRRVD
jgi:hypothetical protein